MTVALLAQTHSRTRRTRLLALLVTLLIVVGGFLAARSVQESLAADVASVLGPTEVNIEITVDGRDVLLRSSGQITESQQNSVAAVSGVASVTVEASP